MRKRGILGIAAALAAMAGSAQAQQPAPGAEEILVTGSRQSRQAVRDFVESVTVETRDQIAKFTLPICPLALGLPANQNAYIAERLRLVAEHLGIGAADEGCEPNVIVVVADSGGDFMRHLRQERPTLFSSLDLSEIRRAMRLEGPVRAWQLVEPRGADGRPMQRISWLEVGDPAPKFIPRGYQLTGVTPSLTHVPTRQDLAIAFVVFDLDAVSGLTLLQIADHAAMRALARTDPSSGAAGRSILGLFGDREAGAAPAAELTGWDVAYLGALYRTMHNVRAHQQRSSIARTMRRELVRPARP